MLKLLPKREVLVFLYMSCFADNIYWSALHLLLLIIVDLPIRTLPSSNPTQTDFMFSLHTGYGDTLAKVGLDRNSVLLGGIYLAIRCELSAKN